MNDKPNGQAPAPLPPQMPSMFTAQELNVMLQVCDVALKHPTLGGLQMSDALALAVKTRNLLQSMQRRDEAMQQARQRPPAAPPPSPPDRKAELQSSTALSPPLRRGNKSATAPKEAK